MKKVLIMFCGVVVGIMRLRIKDAADAITAVNTPDTRTAAFGSHWFRDKKKLRDCGAFF